MKLRELEPSATRRQLAARSLRRFKETMTWHRQMHYIPMLTLVLIALGCGEAVDPRATGGQGGARPTEPSTADIIDWCTTYDGGAQIDTVEGPSGELRGIYNQCVTVEAGECLYLDNGGREPGSGAYLELGEPDALFVYFDGSIVLGSGTYALRGLFREWSIKVCR